MPRLVKRVHPASGVIFHGVLRLVVVAVCGGIGDEVSVVGFGEKREEVGVAEPDASRIND